MNLDQAATFLRISRPTLDRWIRQGLLADAGLRGDRIDRDLLGAWARRHGFAVGGRESAQPTTPTDLFADAIRRGAVHCDREARDAKSAIESALRALDLPADVHAAMLEETLGRERLATTALGNGVAIPHPRKPRGEWFPEPRVSLVYLDPPVDWAAADGSAVHTAILILSPDTRLHLQLLSRIAVALRSPGFHEYLAQRPEQAELADRLQQIVKDQ